MKTFDGGLIVAISAVLISAIIGIASSRFMGDDNPLEEKTEEYIENYVESNLMLPKGSLDGRIDLTPWSEEDEALMAVHSTKFEM